MRVAVIKQQCIVAACVAMAMATSLVLPVGAATPTVARPAKAYVAVEGGCCTNGTVVEVSPATGAEGATIDVGGNPTGIAITPDARLALVANASGYVTVIDTANDTQEPAVPVCGGASAIAITPNGKTALVTCGGGAWVEPIDLRSRTVGAAIVVGSSTSDAIAIAVSPDSRTAYAIDFNSFSGFGSTGTVVPIALANDTPQAPIALTDINATSAALTPDGRHLLVTLWGTTTTGSSVDVIDTLTHAIVDVVHTPSAPRSIAINADGTTAYVACWLGNVILPISLNGGTVPTPLGAGTYGLAVTPDGGTLLSASGGSELDLWATSDFHLIAYAPTNFGAHAVAVTPDQAPRAALRASYGASKDVELSASASVPGTTPITRYDWSFGDGSSAVTSTATVAHRYKSGRDYTATVTLTDAAGTSTQRVFTGQTVSREGSSEATATIVIEFPRG